MNEFGKGLYKALEMLHLGTDEQQDAFSKGLSLLQNKYSDFFNNACNGKNLITDYFFVGRPFSNSEAMGIMFIDSYKLLPIIELDIFDLWESIFPKLQ